MHAVTRFAPSPTGRLHLGHAYSALLAHDFARERGGTFLLRIEDIDPGRMRAEYVDGIFEDLLWLGLEWDGELLYQSERLDHYAEALERLKAEGLIYPCFCTRAEIAAEIAASAAAPQGPDGATPAYPGTCRGLADPDLGRPHAWRLDVAGAMARTGPLYWMDGDTEVQAEPQAFGDVVLARKDAPASYHLAVTLDDAAAGRDRRGARPRPLCLDRRPPAAAGAARPADAGLSSPRPRRRRRRTPRQAPRRADARGPSRRGRRPGGAGRCAAARANCPLDIRWRRRKRR